MTLHTLSSGSQGNCLLLSDGDTHILVDAGISTRRIKAGLAQLELSMDELDGILITHEHTDHISGLATLIKHHAIPLYAPVFPFWWSILWQKHLTPDQSFLTGIIVPHSIVVIEDVGTAQICRSCNGRPPRSPADHLGF